MFLYYLAYCILYPLFKLLYFFKIKKIAKPENGPLIVCANHTQAIDPIFLAFTIGIKGEPRFMAKEQLFKNKFISRLLRGMGAFPVNRDKASAGAIKNALRALKDGKRLLMFPEGTRVKSDEYEKAKAGAGLLASRTGCMVLPVYIPPKKRFFSAFCITVGKAFKPQSTDDYGNISEEIMSRIRELAEI